jgi:hypothetical protein
MGQPREWAKKGQRRKSRENRPKDKGKGTRSTRAIAALL